MSVSTNPAKVGWYRFGFRDDLHGTKPDQPSSNVSIITHTKIACVCEPHVFLTFARVPSPFANACTLMAMIHT